MAGEDIVRTRWIPRLSSLAAPLLLALAGGALAGCTSNRADRGGGGAGVDRSTPEATYHYFKAMAQRGNTTAEWSVFSPNFKRMLNEAAGRNVDLGDYTTARNMIASNSQQDMRMLLASQLSGPAQYLSSDAAVLTITGGGRTIRPRMVRLTTWELTLAGDPQPFTDFARGAGDLITVGGSDFTIRIPVTPGTAGELQRLPKERIKTFKLDSQWYLDDFGGLQLVEGSQQPGPATPPPVAPTPPGGVGSPDG
jgi:hypothetical protein